MSTFLRLMFSNVLDAYLSAIFSFVNIAKSFLLQVAYGLKLTYEIAFHKKLPLHDIDSLGLSSGFFTLLRRSTVSSVVLKPPRIVPFRYAHSCDPQDELSQ